MHSKTKIYNYHPPGKGPGIPQWTLKEFADSLDKPVQHLNQLCRFYPLCSPGLTKDNQHNLRYPLPALKTWWLAIPEERRNPK